MSKPSRREYTPVSIAAFVALVIASFLRSAAEPSATRPSAGPMGAPANTFGLRRPVPKPVPDDPSVVTDEQVDKAIRRAADYLYGRFDPGDPPLLTAPGPKGERDVAFHSNDSGGYGLAVYALLEAGLAVKDARLDPRRREMKALIEGLKAGNFRDAEETYSHAVRATALAVYGRPEDRDALMADTYWLVSVCDGGAYTYRYPAPTLPRQRDGYGETAPPTPAKRPANPQDNQSFEEQIGKMLGKADLGGSANKTAATQPDYSRTEGDRPMTSGELARKIALGKLFTDRPDGEWDNSNSQYGFLGVWSAAEAGVEIPQRYWEAVSRHWTDTQTPEGMWPYQEGILGKHSMTCAGLVALMVIHEYLVPPRISDNVGRSPYDAAVVKALTWFEQGNNGMNIELPQKSDIPGFGLTVPSVVSH